MEEKLTKRQMQAAASKKAIFEAAQELIAQYGYDKVTISDICKKAGVSTGLFYNYFKSKSDIAMESERIVEEWYAEGLRQFRETDTARERLVQFARIIISAGIRDRLMGQNARVHYLRETQGVPPSIFDESRLVFQILYRIVREGKEKGQLSPAVADGDMVRMVFTYCTGAAIHLLNTEDKQVLLEQSVADVDRICGGFEP